MPFTLTSRYLSIEAAATPQLPEESRRILRLAFDLLNQMTMILGMEAGL